MVALFQVKQQICSACDGQGRTRSRCQGLDCFRDRSRPFIFLPKVHGGYLFLRRRHFSKGRNPTPRMRLHPATTEPMEWYFIPKVDNLGSILNNSQNMTLV